MREILFRGKTIDGKWVEGFILNKAKTKLGYYNSSYDFHTDYILPETIGQFTGLTDKNGKKIFEGDIVKAPIYYDIGCYPHTEHKTIVVSIPKIYNRNIDGKMEVIGNIHDNPELLGE